MPLGIADISPSILPPKKHWESEVDVAQYALDCMAVLGLDSWCFGWDKTIRRLGCCKASRQIVQLSIYFVCKYLQTNQDQIQRTILHEIAHALAWEYNRTAGHDPTWHAFCQVLGIGDEKSRTRCESFAPEWHRPCNYRYVLYHLETGEVFQKFSKFPTRTAGHIDQVYIKGRKAETLGKLGIRAIDSAARE